MKDTIELGFGPFHLDLGRRTLRRHGTVLAPGRRALDLLLVLARRPGEVLSHRDLERAIWPQPVDSSNLRAQVRRLRRLLEDDGDGQRYIVNVSGRGYSFIGDIVPRDASPGNGQAYHADRDGAPA